MYVARKRYCVFGCADLSAYMHTFPHPERRSEMFKKWVSIAGSVLKETDPMKIYKNKKICDYHFITDHKLASHRLMALAVPSLHLDGIFLSPTISVQLEHNYSIPVVHPSISKPIEGTGGLLIQDSAKTPVVEDPYARRDLVNRPSTSRMPALQMMVSDDSKEQPTKPIPCKESVGSVAAEEADVKATESDETGMEGDEPAVVSIRDSPRSSLDRELSPVYIADASDDVVQKRYYRCMECNRNIIGFRYVCVQCPVYDACSECEGRGAHAHHYMLRVPRMRPHDEVQAVLEKVRSEVKALFNEQFVPEQAVGVTESEIKEETLEDPLEQVNPSDPLEENYEDTMLDFRDHIEQTEEENYLLEEELNQECLRVSSSKDNSPVHATLAAVSLASTSVQIKEGEEEELEEEYLLRSSSEDESPVHTMIATVSPGTPIKLRPARTKMKRSFTGVAEAAVMVKKLRGNRART